MSERNHEAKLRVNERSILFGPVRQADAFDLSLTVVLQKVE